MEQFLLNIPTSSSSTRNSVTWSLNTSVCLQLMIIWLLNLTMLHFETSKCITASEICFLHRVRLHGSIELLWLLEEEPTRRESTGIERDTNEKGGRLQLWTLTRKQPVQSWIATILIPQPHYRRSNHFKELFTTHTGLVTQKKSILIWSALESFSSISINLRAQALLNIERPKGNPHNFQRMNESSPKANTDQFGNHNR